MKSAFRFAVLLLSANLVMGSAAFAGDEAAQIPVPPAPANNSTEGTGLTLDYLDKAKAAFKDEHYEEALSNIAHAQHDIRLKHAESYRTILPDAPKGWKADNSADNSINLPALGGMTFLSRRYTANGNTVAITFIIDVPPVVVNAMITPPAASASSSDTSAIAFADVKGNKAFYKEGTNAKSGIPMHTLTLAQGGLVITVSSSTVGKDTLAQFASLIDYDALHKMK